MGNDSISMYVLLSAERLLQYILLEGFSSSCTVTQAYYIDIRWGGRSRGLALYYDIGDWRGQSSHSLAAHVRIHTAATGVYMSPIGRGNLMLSTAKEKKIVRRGSVRPTDETSFLGAKRPTGETSFLRATRLAEETSFLERARRYFWE